MPGVYVEGVAEANNGAGKIGPVATGEVVEAGGKEAVDGPEVLDGNPIAAVGQDMVRDVEKSAAFFLCRTVVQGSLSSDHGSGSSPPVPK